MTTVLMIVLFTLFLVKTIFKGVINISYSAMVAIFMIVLSICVVLDIA